MLEQLFVDFEKDLRRDVEKFVRDMGKVRTGRVTTGLIEDVRVNYYNTPTPLNQLASLSVVENKMILIQPFDRGSIGEIEKAITVADLGLNPSNNGQVIRIIIPPLSEERRNELVKVVRRLAEECKVAIRNQRRDCNERVKKLEKERSITEDERDRSLKKVQEMTDAHIARADEACRRKESEILEI